MGSQTVSNGFLIAGSLRQGVGVQPSQPRRVDDRGPDARVGPLLVWTPARRVPRPQSKKAMVRNSMLSRGGVPGGVVGSSKPVCGAKRATDASESQHLISTASSGCRSGR